MNRLLLLTATTLLAAGPANAEDTTAQSAPLHSSVDILPSPLDNPAYSYPASPWPSIAQVETAPAAARTDVQDLIRPDLRSCRDRIMDARAQAGLAPLLKREPANPEKPHLIYAVDRREGGCSVMVMKGDPADIRQLPAPMEGAPLLPADSEQSGR